MYFFYSRMSLKSFRFLDSPVCISCQRALLWVKWERANLAHTWRANWSDLSWLSLSTGREGEMGEEVINGDVKCRQCVKPNKNIKKIQPPLKVTDLYYLVPVRCFACDWLRRCSRRLPAPDYPTWSRPFEHTGPVRTDGKNRERVMTHGKILFSWDS